MWGRVGTYGDVWAWAEARPVDDDTVRISRGTDARAEERVQRPRRPLRACPTGFAYSVQTPETLSSAPKFSRRDILICRKEQFSVTITVSH